MTLSELLVDMKKDRPTDIRIVKHDEYFFAMLQLANKFAELPLATRFRALVEDWDVTRIREAIK